MKKSKNLTTGLYTDDVKTAIRTGYSVSAVPRLIADWNWNRYTVPTATNTPLDDTDGVDIEIFPISSIIEPIRPTKGISKARANEAVVSAGYLSAKSPKFYTADPDDIYKYWTSPYVSNATGVIPNHTDGLTTARPRVTYNRVVSTNKIVIKFENTWASPKDFTVHISTTLGGALGSSIGGASPTIAADGTMTLYYNGTAWVSARPANLVATNIAAIELRVTTLGPGIKRDGNIMTYKPRGSSAYTPTTGAKSSLNVIAMEAHLEADFTNRLVSCDDDFDMAEQSQLYPIGTITSNQGSIVLSNEDGVFNVENTSSPYYGLIEPNTEFNLEYIYTIGATKYSVQQFKMYAEPWSVSDGLASISLVDKSKYLDETKPNPFMVENKTATELVWRVLDAVGFVDYEIQADDLVVENVIPVFWVTGEETVWAVLDSLAKATQTAIYFDSDCKLQVRTRQAAFRETGIDWNLLGVKSGSNLPDIITWSPNSEFEANNIDVTYKTTNWKVNSEGLPAMSKVWEPDNEIMTLRSSPLARALLASDTHLYLEQNECKIWPFESKVQIDGEILSYKGKQFVYYTYTETVQSNGTSVWTVPVRNITNITSDDEYEKFNKKTPEEYRYKNYYTGGLKIDTREVWNTTMADHNIDLTGWTTKLELKAKNGGTITASPRGFTHNKKESTVTIDTPNSMKDADDTYWATRGTNPSTGYNAYGTRFKFNKDASSPTQTAGIAMQLNGTREQGYYVEVRLSSSLSAKERKTANEVTVYSKINGKNVVLSKGSASAIGVDIWYDLDVYISGTGNAKIINVWLNGSKVTTATTTVDTVQPDGGKFGFFARGRTNIDFEYIFGVTRFGKEPVDDYGFYDLKYGGIRGGAWEREYVWEMKTRRKKIKKKRWTKEKYRFNTYLFDEFGPYVHEIREISAKFDPAPVRYSYVFNTNTWYSAVVEYTANPFDANFIMANVSRNHAVVHGEDTTTYAGADSGIDQVCVVLGQDLEIADDETVNKKNESAIRSRGKIDVELSSDWIQSKAMADDIAEWMARHWSDSVDHVEVEIFGNPLIEIGDIVDVLDPSENLAPATHQYFVVGTKNSFDSGVGTMLSLRRRRIATDVS